MQPLQHGKYYHIYNRGNNRYDLFRTPDNYQHFLRLYEKYLSSVANTCAWVLMKNHFHLLVRVKEEGEILPFVTKTTDRRQARCQGSVPLSVVPSPDSGFRRKPNPTRQFSHLFNAYTQSFNKLYNRTGSLFERPFKRLEITSDRYFQRLVVYIHTNPVHHRFTDDFKDYPWSSYGSVISVKPTRLSREKTLGWFNDKANFVEVHKRKVNMEEIEEWGLE